MSETALREVVFRDPVHQRNLENAIDAVEEEHDVEVVRGAPGDGEMSLGEALNELAIAYTGYDAGEYEETAGSGSDEQSGSEDVTLVDCPECAGELELLDDLDVLLCDEDADHCWKTGELEELFGIDVSGGVA